MVDECAYLAYVPAKAPCVRDRKAPGSGFRQRFIVGLKGHALRRYMVERAPQASSGNFSWIAQLQGAGSGVARIGEGSFTFILTFAVQCFEGRIGHQHFAANFELGGIIAVQTDGYVGNAPCIFRHVVALQAVTAGERPCEHSVRVGEAYCSAVELKFAAVGESALEKFVGACGEFFDFGDAVGIAEREHGVAVRTLDEFHSGARLCVASDGGLQVAADTLGGGVGAVEFRELRLQSFQFMHQGVEFLVAHGGSVVHIISAAVLIENGPELFNPLPCF